MTGVELRWLGQPSFALVFAGAKVLVDPFLSSYADRLVPPPFAPEEAVGFDVVAITHDHLDHLDRESLPGIAEASPAAHFLVPAPLVDRVPVPAGRVVGIRPGETAEVAGLRVHGVRALHGDLPADAYSFDGAAGDGLCRFLGYVFDDGNVRVYHSGDTISFDGLVEDLRRLAPDVALLPINGRDAEREAIEIVGNLDEEEAVELAAAVGVDLFVPMHWDMFAANPGSPGRAVELACERGIAVLVPVHDRPFRYLRG